MPVPDLVGSGDGSTPSILPAMPPAPSDVMAADLAAAPLPPPASALPPSAQPQVKATYSVAYPPGQMPSMSAAGQDKPPILVPKTKEKYLDELAATAKPGTLKVLVRRLRPASYDGYRLTLAVVDELDIQPYETLYEAVREWHGGGEYQILVRDTDQKTILEFHINIDQIMNPPKIPINSMRAHLQPNQPYGMFTPPGIPSSLGPGGQLQHDVPETAELRRLRADEQRQLQEEQTCKAQLRALKQQRELKREIEQGDNDMQVNALREEMRTMMQGMKDIVTAALSQPKNEDKTLPLLLENMRSEREQTRMQFEKSKLETGEASKLQMEFFKSLITVMTAKNASGGEMSDSMKVMMAAHDKLVQVSTANSDREKDFNRQLLEAVVSNKLNSGENNIKQMQDMQDRAEEKTMKMMQLIMQMQTSSEDSVINPDGTFWGNLGNVFVNIIGKLAGGVSQSMAGRMGGGMLPAPPSQYALPAPQQMDMPVMQQPMIIPQPAQQAVQQPVYQAPQAAPVQQPREADNVVHMIYDGVLTDTPQVQAPQPQVAIASVSGVQPAIQVAADLSEHVTQAVQMAIADIGAGRVEQDWADYAGGKWGNFLQVLASAPDDGVRIKLIQNHCAPAVYGQFYQLLANDPVGTRNFVTSMHAMLTQYKQDLRNAVA